MSILAILCFLVAIILFLIESFFAVPSPKLLALGLAFFAAGTALSLGLHL